MSGLTTPVDAGAGGDKAYRWTLRIYVYTHVGPWDIYHRGEFPNIIF